MKEFVKQVMLPSSWENFIARIFATLSLITLFYKGFDIGFGPILLTLVQEYDEWLSFCFGPIQQFLMTIADQYFHWKINLFDHWKHIFVLLILFVTAGVKVEFQEKMAGRKSIWVFRLFVGLTTVFTASIYLGTISLEQSNFKTTYMFALVPICALQLYNLVIRGARLWRMDEYELIKNSDPKPTKWQYFKNGAIPIFVETVAIALLAVPIGLLVQQTTSPEIVVIGIFIVYLAFKHIRLGVKQLKESGHEHESWVTAVIEDKAVKIGFSMFGIFGWALVPIAIDYGWRLLGSK